MLAALLHRRRNRRADVRFEAAGGLGQHHREAPLGERAGLVEHDVGDTCEGFDGVRARQQHAAPRRCRTGGRQRRWRGQRQRAGTAHYEHCHRHQYRARRIDPAGPDDAGDRRHPEQRADKPARDAVGQHRQPWLFREGAIQHRHDLGEPRIGA